MVSNAVSIVVGKQLQHASSRVIALGRLLLATLFVIGNFAVDVLYAWLNPKIRYGR